MLEYCNLYMRQSQSDRQGLGLLILSARQSDGQGLALLILSVLASSDVHSSREQRNNTAGPAGASSSSIPSQHAVCIFYLGCEDPQVLLNTF